MNDHVTKPIDVDALLASLNRHIDAQVESVPEPELNQANAPAPACDKPYPALADVDIASALPRVGGRWMSLRKILLTFKAEQESFPDQIEAALDGDENELALRLCHTLKGSSANVGAYKLSAVAEVMESCLKQLDKQGAKGRLNNLRHQASKVFSQIGTLDEQVVERSETPLDKAAIINTIDDIEAHLFKDLVRSQTQWQDIESVLLTNAAYSSIANQIKTYFERFDFKNLKQTLSSLKSLLEE